MNPIITLGFGSFATVPLLVITLGFSLTPRRRHTATVVVVRRWADVELA